MIGSARTASTSGGTGVGPGVNRYRFSAIRLSLARTVAGDRASYTRRVPVCTKCGQDNPDVARFCLACGSSLAAPEPAVEERKLITVLFCDIVGSTAAAEQLDP